MDHAAAPGQAPERDEDRSYLNFSQKLTYSLGQMSVSLSPALISSWLIYYYTGRPSAGEGSPPIMLVSAMAMSLGGFLPRFLEALAEPIVGHLSDKWVTRWGRRIPWIVIGTPLLAFFSIGIWFPPNPDGMGEVWFRLAGVDFNANCLWLLASHTAFWFLYTAVVIPYLALLPEITPSVKERIVVSEFMAYSDVAGTVIGSLGLGLMIDMFAQGLGIGPIRLANGFQVSGFIIGAIFAASFFAAISLVRETKKESRVVVDFHFVESIRETFKNSSFTPYVICSAAIRMTVDILLASMPFMVVVIMGLSEGLAGILQGVIVLGAGFLFPLVSKLAENRGKKGIYLLGMIWFTVAMLIFAMVRHAPFFGWFVNLIATMIGKPMSPSWISFAHAVFALALCAFPVSVIFVLQRPILTDVIDEDARLTGYRREAMYNGMEGLISKPASALAYAIVPMLNLWLGATADRPWGIIAAPILAASVMTIGWVSFTKYPFRQ